MPIGAVNTAERRIRQRRRELREYKNALSRRRRNVELQRCEEERTPPTKLFCPEHGGLQDVIGRIAGWFELSCGCKRNNKLRTSANNALANEPKEESMKPSKLKKRARNYARRRHAACEHGGLVTIGKWAKNTLNDGWLVTIPNAEIGDTVPVVNTKGNYSVVELEKRVDANLYEIRVLKSNGNQKSVLNDSRITDKFKPNAAKKSPQRETDLLAAAGSADVMLDAAEEIVGLA